MTAARRESAGMAGRCDDPAGLGAADWLCLAAAPTFAVMALLTAGPGGDAYRLVCAEQAGAPGLSGMSLMYLLMSAFHAAPWIRLAVRRRSDGDGRFWH